MQDEFNRPELVPQVRFAGDGLTVNGAFVSGEVVLAWVRFAADAGYIRKIDAALPQAYDRVDEDSRKSSVGLFDAITNLIEIAGRSAL